MSLAHFPGLLLLPPAKDTASGRPKTSPPLFFGLPASAGRTFFAPGARACDERGSGCPIGRERHSPRPERGRDELHFFLGFSFFVHKRVVY